MTDKTQPLDNLDFSQKLDYYSARVGAPKPVQLKAQYQSKIHFLQKKFTFGDIQNAVSKMPQISDDKIKDFEYYQNPFQNSDQQSLQKPSPEQPEHREPPLPMP